MSCQQLFLWNYKGFCSYLHHKKLITNSFCVQDRREFFVDSKQHWTRNFGSIQKQCSTAEHFQRAAFALIIELVFAQRPLFHHGDVKSCGKTFQLKVPSTRCGNCLWKCHRQMGASAKLRHGNLSAVFVWSVGMKPIFGDPLPTFCYWTCLIWVYVCLFVDDGAGEHCHIDGPHAELVATHLLADAGRSRDGHHITDHVSLRAGGRSQG